MIDPRAYSEEKIIPPYPLPHVSRKALLRITDSLAPPTCCRYCGGRVLIATHTEVYGGNYSEWPYLYRCAPCDAHVGMHPNTDLPLGLLAKADLRKARNTHKAAFIYLSKRAKWRRNNAYAWLAEQMGIPREDCHWGMFEIEQCKQAGAICRDECNVRYRTLNSQG